MDIQAPDLTQTFPRSPRDSSIAGYVIAARALDKCRAVIAQSAGDYHFAGIKYKAFLKFVATGADDAAVSEWVSKKGKQRKRSEIIAWNNKLRDKQLSKMPTKLQDYLEDYISENIPADKIVRVWFDVYDIEEQRL